MVRKNGGLANRRIPAMLPRRQRNRFCVPQSASVAMPRSLGRSRNCSRWPLQAALEPSGGRCSTSRPAQQRLAALPAAGRRKLPGPQQS